ncbi:MAG: nucleoside monophosphate kinase, partial [Candidatus Marinimicrobia bacterium]|nr:nucleoside monophosphate kinase [Candidatus Neomarinimicrobiota bacterium]
LQNLQQSIDAVISIEANEKELIQRLVLRGNNSGRTDDTSDVAKQRLDVYWKQTAPLIEFYSRRNLLHSINGVGEIQNITQQILNGLS